MTKPPAPPQSPADYGPGPAADKDGRGASDSVSGPNLYRGPNASRQSTRWIWQPLVCHGLDAAACADVWCEHEPEEVRLRLAALLGLDWALARPWLLLLIACHDLGKACPGFRSADDWHGSTAAPSLDPAFVGQVVLRDLLQGRGWSPQVASEVVDAVVCHSGQRAVRDTLEAIKADECGIGGEAWELARRALFEICLAVFRPPVPPPLQETTRHNLPLLSEVARRAEGLSRDEAWFPLSGDVDLHYFDGWFKRSLRRASALINR